MKKNPYFYSEKDSLDFFKLDVVYTDIWNSDKFKLLGSDGLENNKFYRFKEEEIDSLKDISKDVPFLAKNTSGIQAHFITNSRYIKLRVKLSQKYSMHHMTFVGQCGFDLYVYDKESNSYLFHGSSCPEDDSRDQLEYVAHIGMFHDFDEKQLILNFPLYTGVESVEIGIEPECYLKAAPGFENKQRIICYGTSILQGGVVSRPGLSTTNYLSRYYQQEVLNYGFSGAGLLEKEVGTILASRENVEMYIIDAEANAGCDVWMKNNLENFLNEIYKCHPDVPVILMSKAKMGIDIQYERNPIMKKYNDYFQKSIVKKFKKLGKNICFVDNYKLFDGNFTEYTVDGVHPSDLGMMKITENYIKAIDKVRRNICQK
jgi:hypothetical protein